MKKISFSFILLCALSAKVYAQEKRTFKFDKNEVVYYFFSYMTPGFTKFPNHQAKFIIITEENSLEEVFKSNQILNDVLAKKDETVYYYLKLPELNGEKQYSKFLKDFVLDSYNMDFFNRNMVSIDFRNGFVPFGCDILDELSMYFSKIIVSENQNLLSCGKKFIVSGDDTNSDLKTSVRYEPITIKQSQQRREQNKMIRQLQNWEHNYFISLSSGHHVLDDSYRTSFDEETLVDINDVSSMWHITSGYMFTNKIGGLVSIGLMTSQEQTTNSNGISITGTGNGVGILKLGIGARYIYFTNKRWSIYNDVQGGWLSARAKGGSGSVTISNGNFSSTKNITEKTEKTNYLGIELGVNHRLGGMVYLTSNLQYTISNFKNDIGSISGFTGYTINVGIGFSFK